MASSESYLDFILDQLSGAEGITYRKMMGEYILYVNGRIFGGIYDDRFLLKPTPAARRMMPLAAEETPYPGAGAMLLADQVDDRDFLCALLAAMEPELPAPKKR